MDNFYKFIDGIERDPVYICDPNKSPCKNSDICYQPGGCFYTFEKDRALDPSTPLYMAESLIKVNKEKLKNGLIEKIEQLPSIQDSEGQDRYMSYDVLRTIKEYCEVSE